MADTISTTRFALLLSESGGDITAVVIFAMWGGQWEERERQRGMHEVRKRKK